MFESKKLLFYELNEVPRRIITDYAKENPHSAVAHILDRSAFYETFTPDSGHLSPWITWPTLHRGVPNDKHQIKNFGQDLLEANRHFPAYTELLSRAGFKVGIFGSLHTYPLPNDVSNYSFYVPDTFANGPECHPEALSCFQEFNLRMVDLSGRNVSRGMNPKYSLPFLLRAVGLGLKPATILRLMQQILMERIIPSRSVRRRTSQMQIAFDLFYNQLAKQVPDFAAFFTNHVASSMHRYWPAKYPNDFISLATTPQWRSTYDGEIDFAMAETDRQLKHLLIFVKKNPGYSLCIASSMGQTAVDRCDSVKTQLLITDIKKFMRGIVGNPEHWHTRRAMIPMYVIALDPSVTDVAKSNLSELRINGSSVDVVDLGSNIIQIFFLIENPDPTSMTVTIAGKNVRPEEIGLGITEIEDESGSYAYHIPEGIFMVYNPLRPKPQHCGTVPTTAIAPAVLRNFGIECPSYMRD